MSDWHEDFGDEPSVEERMVPQGTNVEEGKRYHKAMPASEVMIHMQVVDQVFTIELFGDMVQLYHEDGTEFSSKVTAGEAGLYYDAELDCYYFYDE